CARGDYDYDRYW
nr:immunoglobulin heavy chain junction region [Mus musculus]